MRPMRGVKPTQPLTQFPYWGSPKIDGMRAVVRDGLVLSKTLKPIPSQSVQELFKHLHGRDGELTVGPPHRVANDLDGGVWERSRGPLMSKKARPDTDFRFHVFDLWDHPIRPFHERLKVLSETLAHVSTGPHICLVEHRILYVQDDVDAFEAEMLELGYEGIMLRQYSAPYKYGQATEREGYLIKIKRFEDGEGEIIDFVEQVENTNKATIDELGYMKRSSSKAGKRPKGLLGSFVLRLEDGTTLSVGTGQGLTNYWRKVFWRARPLLKGKFLRFKYQEVGTQNAPRIPLYAGFRDKIDLAQFLEES